jgi:imidazolonepropionase-like amidohydrolase
VSRRGTALSLLLVIGLSPVCATLATAQVPEAPPVIAIRGGRVVTVSGPVLEKGTVVLSGGRIAAVGADVAVPPGATLVEAAGKTVYPGLIDGLTTLGLQEVGSVPGSVDVREIGDVNPHAQAWVAVHPHSDLIPVARANGLTAVVTAPQGGLVSGQSAVVRLAGTTPDALTVKTPAAMHVTFPTGRRTADAPAGEDPPEPKSFEDRLKEKRENQTKDLKRLAHLLQDAKAYAAGAEAARRDKADPLRPDPALAALAPAARGEVPVVIRADDEADIRRSLELAKEQRLKLIIAGGLEAWRCAKELRAASVPVLLTVDRLPGREKDPYDAAFANAAALHRAGVSFAIVTDDASQVRNLPYEAAMARAYGLPSDVALRAITLSPAEIFGVADRMGSLEAGKAANVVIATGDIMDHRTEVTHVFIDGVAQSLETRHTRLYEQFRNRR